MQINILMLLSFLMNINILVLTKVQYNPNTMLSQTFAQIRNLSNQLPDPNKADRAMHQLLCTNIKCPDGQKEAYIGESSRCQK